MLGGLRTGPSLATGLSPPAWELGNNFFNFHSPQGVQPQIPAAGEWAKPAALHLARLAGTGVLGITATGLNFQKGSLVTGMK